MDRADIAYYLSIWGAISGTIAVIATALNMIFNGIKLKQEAAKLNINCKIDYGFDVNLQKKQEITVSSLGKKLIYFDYIEYYIIPETFYEKVFKNKLYKQDKYIYRQSIHDVKLSEGQNVILKINMPNGLELENICKVKIVDQTGRKWNVSWPSIHYLKDFNKKVVTYLKEKESTDFIVVVTGYEIWNFYFVHILLSEKKKMSKTIHSYRRFSDIKSFNEEINKLEKDGMDNLLEKGIT